MKLSKSAVIRISKAKSRYQSDFKRLIRVIPLGLNIAITLGLGTAMTCESCTVLKQYNPKIAKIRLDGNHYHVYVWHYDRWYMKTFKNLPDSIKKGNRVSLDGFTQSSNPVRAWK